MDENTKIQFIKGEEYARYYGELTTPDWFKSKLGIDAELDWFDKKIIIVNSIIYSDLLLGDILMSIGEHYNGYKYDAIDSRGMTTSYDSINDFLEGKSVFNTNFIKDIKTIKPYNDFYITYPNFNNELYNTFMKDFDEYYELKYN